MALEIWLALSYKASVYKVGHVDYNGMLIWHSGNVEGEANAGWNGGGVESSE